MYSFIFYLVSSFFSAMCCDLMSIVQVAFVNPLMLLLLSSDTAYQAQGCSVVLHVVESADKTIM